MNRLVETEHNFQADDGLYHEIYNEAAPDRANVLNDLGNWLSTQILPTFFMNKVLFEPKLKHLP